MMSWFIWVEESALSVWMRESTSLLAFPFILFLHTLGLAMLAGINVAIDFWLLTFASRMPRLRMAGFYRVMWLGFGINLVSGVLLLIAYPAKALTNPVFYTKILLVVLGVIVLDLIRKEVFAGARPGAVLAVTRRAKWLASISLAAWGGTIFAGRLLAYTHHILMASDAN